MDIVQKANERGVDVLTMCDILMSRVPQYAHGDNIVLKPGSYPVLSTNGNVSVAGNDNKIDLPDAEKGRITAHWAVDSLWVRLDRWRITVHIDEDDIQGYDC